MWSKVRTKSFSRVHFYIFSYNLVILAIIWDEKNKGATALQREEDIKFMLKELLRILNEVYTNS